MPWRFFAQYQINSQMMKLVATSRHYSVLKVKASCIASVVAPLMQLNVEKCKPRIWKYATFNMLGWALYTQDSFFWVYDRLFSKCWFIFHVQQENKSEFSELRKENTYFFLV